MGGAQGTRREQAFCPPAATAPLLRQLPEPRPLPPPPLPAPDRSNRDRGVGGVAPRRRRRTHRKKQGAGLAQEPDAGRSLAIRGRRCPCLLPFRPDHRSAQLLLQPVLGPASSPDAPTLARVVAPWSSPANRGRR